MILLYDGSFEGYLSLVHDVYYDKLKPTQILKKLPETLLLDEIKEIDFQKEKSDKVLHALKTKFTKSNFEMIFHIFMCDSVEFELDLLRYIILGFKDQRELANINHPFIFTLQGLQRELFRHGHKMTGFTRFSELEDGTLYAKIDTKFNVVFHLGKHFLSRFNNQNYIIHDIKRHLAFVKIDSSYQIQEVATFDEPTYSQNEEKFANLWKTFFTSVAIKSRENKKLQKQMVPLIYRTFMTEFKEN